MKKKSLKDVYDTSLTPLLASICVLTIVIYKDKSRKTEDFSVPGRGTDLKQASKNALDQLEVMCKFPARMRSGFRI